MIKILNFLELNNPFDLAPASAVEAFRAKGLRPTFSYGEMIAEEHSLAFTVAKMMDVDLLKDVQDSLDQALALGVPFKQWADSIMPTLQEKGWWGRQAVKDPISGETIVTELGSPHRLNTIFRTNMASSYAAGQWEQMDAQKAYAPYLMYDAVDDFRVRPLHKAWDGKVLPFDSGFWKTHYPPNGWNCRCSVIQLDDSDLEMMNLEIAQEPKEMTESWTNSRTGKTQKIPKGIDPGFQYNAGVERKKELDRLLAEKVASLPPSAQAVF